MESLQENVLLKFRPDTLEGVRKIYGFEKREVLNEAIDILDDWVKCQNHFIKKDFSRDYLEKTIVTAKGSLERAKLRMDKVCTLRTWMPQFFGDFNAKEDFKNLHGTCFQACLPRTTEDHNRIILVKIVGKQFDSAFFLNAFRLIPMVAEYEKAYDYVNKFIFILDFLETNMMEFVAKLNPIDIHKQVILLTEGYGCRIHSIHMLTASKMIDALVTILKQVLSAKVGGRIYTHKNVESLYAVVPKDLLPSDYGGKEKTLPEMSDEIIDALSSKEFREYLREMNRAGTDEALRLSTDSFHDQYLGMPGTFRNLSVD